jgi:hypothetical protein
MGEEDGHRTQAVFAEHLVELGHHADARIDDEALLAGLRCDDVAVRAERLRGEAHNEHAFLLQQHWPGAPERSTLDTTGQVVT